MDLGALAAPAAARIRELEPGTIAVVVMGSFARGTADEHSDLDLRAITDADPRISYRSWFQEQPDGGAPLHVSASAKSLVNEEKVVRDRREALAAALSLSVAPEHYREDFAVCLGVAAADDATVLDATLRLGRELLAFLREHRPDVDPQPDIARYLSDGTLERHLGFGSD